MLLGGLGTFWGTWAIARGLGPGHFVGGLGASWGDWALFEGPGHYVPSTPLLRPSNVVKTSIICKLYSSFIVMNPPTSLPTAEALTFCLGGMRDSSLE